MIHCQFEVWSDASAALDIIHKTGLGKTRHIDTRLLWIQQTAAEQRLKFQKVLGKHNPADLFTKHLDQHTSEGHIEILRYMFGKARFKEAPELHMIRRSAGEYLTNVSQVQWPSLHVIFGNGSTLNDDNGNWRYGRYSKGIMSGQTQKGDLGVTSRSRTCSRREVELKDNYMTTDGLRTAGAPEKQLTGTGVQRPERRPACQP